MIKKHLVLICIFISAILMVGATSLYPGGSILDKNAAGFNWAQNFISNLFGAKAINGAENPARIWAMAGMAFHSVGFALFFINTSRKMPAKHPATVLKTIGAANVLFTFLIVTALHDAMVTLSSTLFLLGLFYITVYVLRTKLHMLKISCIICMLVFYYTLFLYGSGNWGLLAIMQKVSFGCSMLLALGIEYFSRAEDFTRAAETGKQ